MAKTAYRTVDEYLADQPAPRRAWMDEARAVLRDALPAAQEGISYQMPVLRIGGTMVLYYAGYKNHFSMYPASAEVLAGVGEELLPHLASRATIHFSWAEPVPVDLLRRIATARATEVAAAPKKRR